jgi:hypothetical protein
MKPTSSSPCIATTKVTESRDFYVKHFAATVTFDCGWYVSVSLGEFRRKDRLPAIRLDSHTISACKTLTGNLKL